MAHIHRLAHNGDPYELRELLLAGEDPNQVDSRGQTPLHRAHGVESLLQLRILIDFGADPHYASSIGESLLSKTNVRARRFLLENGLHPDAGTKAGKRTLAAFFAELRERSHVELLVQYGASADAMIRDGRSIRELLLDECYWRKPEEEAIRQFSERDEALLQLSENLTITPREYVARHRGIMIWGFHRSSIERDDLFEWSQEVARLLNSPEDLEAAYRQYLDEETLNRELKAIERSKLRHQRDLQRKERRAAYIAEFYPGDPMFD